MSLNFGENYTMGQGINRFAENEKYDFKTQTSNYIDKNINQTSLYSLQERFDDITERQVIYYFDVIKSHRIQLQSQITDYWLENNTAVQDTINVAPILITLSGMVGEVVFTPPTSFIDTLANKLNNRFPSNSGFTLTQKLGVISSIIPSVDNYTQLAKNAISYTESAFNRYKKLYETVKSFKNGTASNIKSKQQQIYESFEKFQLNRTSLIVNTPYGVFENMFIQNVTMEQTDTNTVSNVTVTLKQLSFKEVEFTSADPSYKEKYNGQATSEPEKIGKTKNQSIAYQSLYKINPDVANWRMRRAGQ